MELRGTRPPELVRGFLAESYKDRACVWSPGLGDHADLAFPCVYIVGLTLPAACDLPPLACSRRRTLRVREVEQTCWVYPPVRKSTLSQ